MFKLDFTRSYYCYVCHPKDNSVCLSLDLHCFSFISLKTKFHASMQLNYVPFRFISLKTFLRLFATELSCFKLYQGQKRFSALFVLSPYLTFKGNWCSGEDNPNAQYITMLSNEVSNQNYKRK